MLPGGPVPRFDLPIGYFFTPPAPAVDAGLYGPDTGSKGLDPIVLLDAILGTPDNLGHWMEELLAYSASHAPRACPAGCHP